MNKLQCGFVQSWVGPCKNLQPCEAHMHLECVSCGAPATRDCHQTGQFVCGAPLCGECEHTIFPDGTNGGIGFNAQDLPEGMKRHCKKTEQKHKSWVGREVEDTA